MNQITIDREGARRLYAFIDSQRGNDAAILRALESAAAGDFAALAALVGTREVAMAPVAAHSFREGDVVTHRERGPGWVVTLSQRSPPLGFALNLTRGADSHYAAAALCTLTHRRHFKAGERCPVVAVGQTLMLRNGICVSITERDGDTGWFGVWGNAESPTRTYMQNDEASRLPLAFDWSADAAIPCEVGA